MKSILFFVIHFILIYSITSFSLFILDAWNDKTHDDFLCLYLTMMFISIHYLFELANQFKQ